MEMFFDKVFTYHRFMKVYGGWTPDKMAEKHTNIIVICPTSRRA